MYHFRTESISIDTEDLWPTDGRDRPDMGPIYNVYALSRLLTEVGYIEVEPVKWANTPIGMQIIFLSSGRGTQTLIMFVSTVKFRDPTSGVFLDLNTNDLGGEANSRMILAYCRLAPFTLRPLIHVVKTWAKCRNLNDSSGSQGSPTLSSYCWTLMCIAYLQSIGKLPNLQDSESVKKCGRENCVIWVSWGKPQGQAANIGFADPLVDDSAAFQTPIDDIGEIVKGFFTFYYNMLRKDEGYEGEPTVIHNGRVPDARLHIISVWKGGLTDRSIPIDATSSAAKRQKASERKHKSRLSVLGDSQLADGDVAMTSGVEESEKIDVVEEMENAEMDIDKQVPATGRQQQPTKGRRVRKFLPSEELPRGPEVDGFAQPERWSMSDLVVQDPFLHDKVRGSGFHCAKRTKVGFTFIRIVQVLCRAPTMSGSPKYVSPSFLAFDLV